MEDIKDLIPYKVLDDEGDFYFYSDASKETLKAILKVLYTLDTYDYDYLKDILKAMGFRYESHEIEWVII